MTATATATDNVIVLDFETTGLSPDHGDRAIEIGAVRIEQGQLVDRFQQLMDPGRPISAFIESYTGISNGMLTGAAPCEAVMDDFARFIQGANLVAHNASFDRRFLEAELNRINLRCTGSFACSMLASRRIYPEAPNHKLGTLVNFKHLPNDGTFHRALADAEMTAHLWLAMLEDIQHKYQLSHIGFDTMVALTRTQKAQVDRFFYKQRS